MGSCMNKTIQHHIIGSVIRANGAARPSANRREVCHVMRCVFLCAELGAVLSISQRGIDRPNYDVEATATVAYYTSMAFFCTASEKKLPRCSLTWSSSRSWAVLDQARTMVGGQMGSRGYINTRFSFILHSFLSVLLLAQTVRYHAAVCGRLPPVYPSQSSLWSA